MDDFPTSQLTKLRRNLRRWHEKNGRELPWRAAGDAYRVWISEIMLQQTTVTAVVPYYERFLSHFPDVYALAAADEQDVLKLWEGLGYYSRARNIHKTARRIVEDYAGRFPQDVEQLHSLPGIGRYTAGAIASFALDQPAPIVEANTLRLYCRLLSFDGDPRSTTGQRLLWSFAGRLMPRKHPGDFNQALMDLGATICTVTDPDCPRCPLRTVCQAHADGRVDEIPLRKEKTAVTAVTEASIAVHRRGAYLLRRRGEKERWAGLWDFLRFEISTEAPQSKSLPAAVYQSLISQVRETSGTDIRVPQPVGILRHSVTRYRITLHCLSAQFESGRLSQRNGPLVWVKPAKFEDYPLSVTGRKFAHMLMSLPSQT